MKNEDVQDFAQGCSCIKMIPHCQNTQLILHNYDHHITVKYLWWYRISFNAFNVCGITVILILHHMNENEDAEDIG